LSQNCVKNKFKVVIQGDQICTERHLCNFGSNFLKLKVHFTLKNSVQFSHFCATFSGETILPTHSITASIRRHCHASVYNVWTASASEKCSIIANIKSTTRFPTSYRWSTYVTPNTPNGGSKSEVVVYVNKIKVQSNNICYSFVCENFQRQSCSSHSPI